MGNYASRSNYGYVCPVRGCDKRKNRRFTLMGLCTHIEIYHGDKELEKRIKAKQESREE